MMEQEYFFGDWGHCNIIKQVFGLEMLDALLFGQLFISEVEDISLMLV